MFKLKGKLQFVTIDQSYLKALHDACSEVYFKGSSYDSKPYFGIFACESGAEYVIALSSAKPKHAAWKDVESDRFLVYETLGKTALLPNYVYKIQHGKAKHLLSVIDLKKMIPVKAGLYQSVNLNGEEGDDAAAANYKCLLNKEYSFCLRILDKVIAKASNLYRRQMTRGRTLKFCCNFNVLEKLCQEF